MRPELLTRIDVDQAARYILDDRFWVQEKWDAERLLVRRSGQQVQGWNKQGQTTAVAPALTSALLSLSVTGFVLDGEYGPSAYNCWDLLRADQIDLTSYAYEERYGILKAFSPCPYINVIPTWTTKEQKEAIIFDLVRKGAEGVVFKDRRAPYQAGRAGQHFKLKFENSATVRVRSVDPTRNSARIEMLDAGTWVEVCGIKIEKGSVQPGNYIEVRYASASASTHLVQPVFLRIRHDVSDDDCSTEQLKFTGRWASSAPKYREEDNDDPDRQGYLRESAEP
jgi:bifunctional non-homologous end joining protein LigD